MDYSGGSIFCFLRAATFRSVFGDSDFSIHLASGAFKSELANQDGMLGVKGQKLQSISCGRPCTRTAALRRRQRKLISGGPSSARRKLARTASTRASEWAGRP